MNEHLLIQTEFNDMSNTNIEALVKYIYYITGNFTEINLFSTVWQYYIHSCYRLHEAILHTAVAKTTCSEL